MALGACLERPAAGPARVGARGLFALGYVFGLAFYLIGTHWIALLSDVAITVPWLKYPAWVAAAAYLALYSGLAVWLAGMLARRAPLAIAFPVAFLVVEELRASGELGRLVSSVSREGGATLSETTTPSSHAEKEDKEKRP